MLQSINDCELLDRGQGGRSPLLGTRPFAIYSQQMNGSRVYTAVIISIRLIPAIA